MIGIDMIAFSAPRNADRRLTGSGNRGSGMLSGLANFQRDRLQALAYLAVGYHAPAPDYDYHEMCALIESVIGYVNFGYWEFHNEDDAGKTIDEHVRCSVPNKPLCQHKVLISMLVRLLYKPNLHERPRSLAQARLPVRRSQGMDDKQYDDPDSSLGERRGTSSFVSMDAILKEEWHSNFDQDQAVHDEIFKPQNGGYGPPTNWYKVMVRKLNNADSAGIFLPCPTCASTFQFNPSI